MNLGLRARLSLCYGDSLPDTLVKSLSPDDIPPKRFSLRGYYEGVCYVYEILCENCVNEDLLTLASILSEVILLSKLVKKVVRIEEDEHDVRRYCAKSSSPSVS
ncbi:MAG: hypothetical protein QXV72_00775 [Sulfolobales archaeon]